MKRILFFLVAILMGATVLMSCKQVKPVKTIEHLKAAIVGETTASAKYLAFAQKAREEGADTIAILFEAASKSESIHAANHAIVLNNLGEKMEEFTPQFEVKSTKENLEAALNGEKYEVDSMYPAFIADAQAENVNDAVTSFSWALDTENKHGEFYAKSLEAWSMMKESGLPVAYMICPKCGNTYDAANVEENCSFCMTGKDKFIPVP